VCERSAATSAGATLGPTGRPGPQGDVLGPSKGGLASRRADRPVATSLGLRAAARRGSASALTASRMRGGPDVPVTRA